MFLDTLLDSKIYDNFNGAEVKISYTGIKSVFISKLDSDKNATTNNLYGKEVLLMKFLSQGLNFKMRYAILLDRHIQYLTFLK